ncbi:MAG: hypothetical protein EX341_17020 [Candidatus Scalindua sp. SCAELEC01]|nr:hypothetical protein [Planctomycetota bacterium]RZV67437.1 MAG: hypothetical protein EX341_17020 [Candidatus Scalindua sp. SCAELEC01]
MRRILFIILAIYLSQVLFAPIIHCFSEWGERDCADCCDGGVVNSSCDGTNGPCENPAHHHHNNHRHDPAHCTLCETFFQDIECVSICYGIAYKCVSIISKSTFTHSGMLSKRLFLVRAPPV